MQGARSSRFPSPDSYPERRGLPVVEWGEDSRSFTIKVWFSAPRPGTDSDRYALGVLDSEDPDLQWREFGDLIPGAKTWIDSVFRP